MIESPYYHLVPEGAAEQVAWRQKILEWGSESPENVAELKLMCSRDLLFWVNTFVFTYDPRPTAKHANLPFNTYEDFQDEALLKIQDAIESGYSLVIEKSRDMGASWMILLVFIWFWLYRPMSSFLVGSRNEKYVDGGGNMKALFPKIDHVLKFLPKWLLPVGWDKRKHRNHLTLENPENNARIDGEATTGDFAAGDRRTALLFDEFARHENGVEALASSGDATQCRIFNSTPVGTGNAHYTMVQKERIPKLRLYWMSHPFKRRGAYSFRNDGTVEFLDDFHGEVMLQDKKYMFPEEYPFDEFNDGNFERRSPAFDNAWLERHSVQEMAQEWEIDYLRSGYQYFNQIILNRLEAKTSLPSGRRGSLVLDSDAAEVEGFTDHQRGEMKLWINLDARGKPPVSQYTAGIDISTGTGSSNSVIAIADRVTGEKVAEWASSTVMPYHLAIVAVAICKWFHGAYMLYEVNGPGKEFASKREDLRYSNIYYRRREDAVNKKVSDIPGWWSSKESKRDLLGAYRNAIQGETFIERSAATLRECSAYVDEGGKVVYSGIREMTDSDGNESNHGDRVVASALAYKGCKDRPVGKNPLTMAVPYNSLEGRHQRLMLEQSQQKRDDAWV